MVATVEYLLPEVGPSTTRENDGQIQKQFVRSNLYQQNKQYEDAQRFQT